MGSNTSSIVVGIDGSASAIDSARWAGAVAVRMGVPLHLVHVMRTVEEALLGIVSPHQEDAGSYASELGHEMLRHAADTVRADFPELPISRTLSHRPITDTLVELSRRARLVVLACDEVTPVGALLPGSTTLTVSTRAYCPVVAWRGGILVPNNSPVVVGVGDNPESRSALVTAFVLADLFGVDLKAVHAIPEQMMTGDVDVSVIPDWDAVESDALQRLSTLISTVGERWPAVHATSVVKTGTPGRVILGSADGAQVIVVGTRGRNNLASVVLGSTGLSLLHHCAVPIVVCPASYEWDVTFPRHTVSSSAPTAPR